MINLSLEKVCQLPSVPFEHRALLPESAGIYFVIAYTPNPQLVYLGKAQNFYSRWLSHHREPELQFLLKLDIRLDIAWLDLRCHEEIIRKWERSLIDQLNPALNDGATLRTEVRKLGNKIAALEEYVVSPEPLQPGEFREPTAPLSRNILNGSITDLETTWVLYLWQKRQWRSSARICKRVWGVSKGGGPNWKTAREKFQKILLDNGEEWSSQTWLTANSSQRSSSATNGQN